MKYILGGNYIGLDSASYSTLNSNTSVWSNNVFGDISGNGLNIPTIFYKGEPGRIPGLYAGSASCGNFFANGPWSCAGTIQYKSDGLNTTTIVRGTNYQITDIAFNQTILLPSSPIVGDYVWYENHPSSSGRFTITIDGNGKSIRTATNSIVTTTLSQGLFHYDGTYWNNLYEA